MRLVFLSDGADQPVVVTAGLIIFFLALFCFAFFSPVFSLFFFPPSYLRTRQLAISLIKLIYSADQIFWLQPAVQFFSYGRPQTLLTTCAEDKLATSK